MSEPVKKVEGISTDSVIDVQISGAFYHRLHQLLIHHCAQKSLEDFPKALAAIKDNKISNEYEYHLETLLTLITSTETAAKEQGKIVSKDLP